MTEYTILRLAEERVNDLIDKQNRRISEYEDSLLEKNYAHINEYGDFVFDEQECRRVHSSMYESLGKLLDYSNKVEEQIDEYDGEIDEEELRFFGI